MKTIVLAATNDISTDNRVIKIASTLSQQGNRIIVIGRILKTSLALPEVAFKCIRMKILFNKGPLFYLFYNIQLLLKLLFIRAQIIVANDLDTLPACAIAARLKKNKLVYDAHEYFTEVPELQYRPTIKKIWKSIENRFISNIDAGITVCNSIANIFKTEYNKEFQVIRNVPFLHPVKSKDNYPIPDKPYILYQGWVNMGRGIELAIEAMQYIEDKLLVIAGDGDIFENVKKLASDLNVANKVIFTGRLPIDTLSCLTNHAFVGISIEENLGLNYYYALPNKLFSYINAKVPALVSDHPEMSAIVNNYNVGMLLKERTPESFSKIIHQMSDVELRTTWTNNLIKAREELCWEKESEKLIRIYSSI